MSTSQEYAVFVHNVLQVVGLTILYYDHYLTLPREVQYIWRRGQRTSLSTTMFLINRYFGFFSNIVVGLFVFMPLDSKKCPSYNLFRNVVILASGVFVFFVMFIRTYALWNRSRRVFWFIASSGVVLFTLAVWGLQGQKTTFDPRLGACHGAIPLQTGIHLAVPWEAQFTMDTIICVLTFYRTHQLVRGLSGRARARMGILGLMLRDGALYFGLMAIANIANSMTYYFADALLRGVLSTFASVISISMCSRMMLNMHEKAHRERRRARSTTASARPTNPAGGQFTTRFVSVPLPDWDEDEDEYEADEARGDPLMQNGTVWRDEELLAMEAPEDWASRSRAAPDPEGIEERGVT